MHCTLPVEICMRRVEDNKKQQSGLYSSSARGAKQVGLVARIMYLEPAGYCRVLHSSVGTYTRCSSWKGPDQ